MELVLAALNGAFVLVMTLVLTWYIRDRFGEVNQEIRELRAETREDIAAIRSDLMHIVLTLGVQPRPDSA
jgi:hypothetical protein